MLLKELYSFGLPVAPYKIVKDFDEARSVAKGFKYPVVMKLASDTIHKTDVGGVVIDIYSDEMLKTTWQYFKKKFGDEPVLIQKQIKKGIELYIGVKKDPSFGRIILFGLGGVYVEVFKDISARICPITDKDVDSMINDLKAKKVLLGYRGKSINLNLLKRVLVAICAFAEKNKVKEMDINPFKIGPKDGYILDARVVKE